VVTLRKEEMTVGLSLPVRGAVPFVVSLVGSTVYGAPVG
jgi:hypothetical protein